MAENPLSMESGDNTSNGINVTPGAIIDSEPPRYSNVQSRKKPSRRIRHRDIKNENRVKKNKPMTNEITPMAEIIPGSHCICEINYEYFNWVFFVLYIGLGIILTLVCVIIPILLKDYLQALLGGVALSVVWGMIALCNLFKCKYHY
jgi:hypothetical protein